MAIPVTDSSRSGAWTRSNATYFTCFAAGVLLAVSFLHIVPEALASSPYAPAWLLGGYLLMHAINRFLNAYVCDTPERAEYALGLVPPLGIGLHSFIDGIVYSISFTTSTYTGILVAIGIGSFAHQARLAHKGSFQIAGAVLLHGVERPCRLQAPRA